MAQVNSNNPVNLPLTPLPHELDNLFFTYLGEKEIEEIIKKSVNNLDYRTNNKEFYDSFKDRCKVLLLDPLLRLLKLFINELQNVNSAQAKELETFLKSYDGKIYNFLEDITFNKNKNIPSKLHAIMEALSPEDKEKLKKIESLKRVFEIVEIYKNSISIPKYPVVQDEPQRYYSLDDFMEGRANARLRGEQFRY